MKIAVNGNIIDTENIRRIGKIKKTDSYTEEYCFEIEMFGKDILFVTLSVYVFTQIGSETKCNIPAFMNEEELKKWKKDKEVVVLKELNRVREEVIKYWSENQSKIPQIEFNLPEDEHDKVNIAQ